MRGYGYGVIILVALCVLVGCQATAPATPTERPRPTAVAATRTPFPTWTPTATALPATPFPTRAAIATPRPTVAATPIPVCAPVWQRAFSKNEPLGDLILFTSAVHAPFAPANTRQRATPNHLWAIAVDGRNSERLSFREDALFIRSTTGDAVVVDLLVTQPLTLATDFVRQHVLLPECASGAAEFPCGEYRFSPSGTWVAYFWGEEICGRGIAALDLRADETRILAAAGGHSFTFLADETMLIGVGHCEGGDLVLADLRTGEQNVLGEAGVIQWNAQRTALAVKVSPYLGWGNSVWGYDMVRGQHFLSPAPEHETEATQRLWTATGSHLLYQQRAISYTTPAKAALTLGPQQIIVVDAATGERQTLLNDPAYDYHLCMAYQVCAWEGDFIEVRRIPYRPNSFVWEVDPSSAAVDCAMYGFRCPDPVERFALNWRTGELVPWDARPSATETPTVTPTPTPAAVTPQSTAPDLARPAFYTAPDGTYTLRLGQDGQSLWCVPAGGEPVLWVNTGAHFTYVP